MWNRIKTLILSWFRFKRKLSVTKTDINITKQREEVVSAKQKTVPMTHSGGSVIKQLKRTHRKNPTYS